MNNPDSQPRNLSSSTSTLLDSSSTTAIVEGCKKCKQDNDHSNLLLCEACNDEYHIYCLDPPLSSVPENDFFCHKCKPLLQTFVNNNDDLDKRVSSLPPLYTCRFGEIIWAAGGSGFGWWPACIYDPRLTVGGARKLALKNLGKKHLVYFFACPDAPFSVLPDAKCVAWENGLWEDYDEGKVAKGVGRQRFGMFQWALQAAIAEYDKPIECRMEWNHEQDPIVMDGGRSGAVKGGVSEKNRKKRSLSQVSSSCVDHHHDNHDNNDNHHHHDNNNDDCQGQHEKKQRSKISHSTSVNDLEATRRSNRTHKPTIKISSNINSNHNNNNRSPSANNNDDDNDHQVHHPSQQHYHHFHHHQQKQHHSDIKSTNRQSFNEAVLSANGINHIEESFDLEYDNNNNDQFFCQVLRKVVVDVDVELSNCYKGNGDGNNDSNTHCSSSSKNNSDNNNNNYNNTRKSPMFEVNIGFIVLSKTTSTFSDARKKIMAQFDDDMLTPSSTFTTSTTNYSNNNTNHSSLGGRKKNNNNNWKFYIPHLGPMSRKQETKFGSMYDMLIRNGDGRVGNGTSRHPLKVIIYHC